MRFSLPFLDDIRARVPISEVIGARVRFDGKKSNAARGDYWGCCPFHGEKTPSFHCDDRRGRYHCFGCGASGDIFRFLTELDGLSFHEAVERLAGQAGLPMPKPDAQAAAKEKQRDTLYDIMEKAAVFYENALQAQTEEALAARTYLHERGLSPALQKQFRLGLAPRGNNALKQFFTGAGIDKILQEQSGLFLESREEGNFYDRFRHRIMFPIADIRGKIIAFGGRALSAQDKAKYLNSPETELFHKGRVLYNLAQARAKMRGINGAADKPLLVVEGYIDVAALAQAGIYEAVAPLGTALTEEQLALLWRFCPQPILCFDGDKAGLTAAYRALDRALPLLRAGISLRFALLPDGQDPDDMVRAQGRAAFLDILAAAMPPAELLWRRETAGQSFATPESRAGLEKRLREAAFTIRDDRLRSYYLQDIRQRLWEHFRRSGQSGGQKTGRQGGNSRIAAGGFAGGSLITENLAHSSLVRLASLRQTGGFAPREAAILAILAAYPVLWHENFDSLAGLEFTAPELQRFYQAVMEILAQFSENPHYDRDFAADNEAEAQALAVKLEQAGQKTVLDKIKDFTANLGLAAAQSSADPARARAALKQALILYRRAHFLHKQISEIEADLLSAPDSGSFTRLKALREELRRADNLDAGADDGA